MLDTKSTFDQLVTRNAATPSRRSASSTTASIATSPARSAARRNTWRWRSCTSSTRTGGFDLIVVDTPPTRHALDFLDAPRRLLRLLDNRIFRLLMMPTRAYLKVASVAVQTFLRTVARVVGSEVIDDVVAFFRAFEGMEAGFRDAGRAPSKSCSPTPTPRSCS